MIDKKQFWNRLNVVLFSKDITLHQLAWRTHIPYEFLQEWRKKFELPDLESMIVIVEKLNTSLDYLLLGVYNREAEEIKNNPALKQLVDLCIDKPKVLKAINTMVSLNGPPLTEDTIEDAMGL